MKVLSLYCGAGGIDEGLRQAGIETTTAIDSNLDCCNTFKLNHPNAEIIHGEVADYINSFSGYQTVVGGPPCQDFSIAKLGRRMFSPVEVDNFWEVVERNNPKYYLMENVKDVIKVCDKDNYLVNCADYGTPQLRQRRLFTNLPLPKTTHENNYVSIKDAIGFDGLVQDRKSTFGEKYGKEDGKFRERPSTRPCFTVVTDYRIWLLCNGLERKATDQEVAVLQGFPSSYKFTGTIKSIKRQIGNAVPSQPIKALFSQIVMVVPAAQSQEKLF